MTEVRPITTRNQTATRGRHVVALLKPGTTGILAQGSQILAASGVETRTGNIDGLRRNAGALKDVDILIVETDPKTDTSALKQLTEAFDIPIIAAIDGLSLADARHLMHLGIVDAIPLPLGEDDLAQALQAAYDVLANRPQAVRTGCATAFIKSVGGVGATVVATQTAGKLAQQLADTGKTACLIDLDIQFGSAALQLDLAPTTTMAELLRAGQRLDSELLGSVAVRHASGLYVIAAPPDVVPLEAVSTEMAVNIVRVAAERFDHIIIDLPGAWTNWSLDVLGCMDLAFLITELTVPSIRQAKRQLQLLDRHDMSKLPLRIVANRYERGWLKSVDTESAEQVLKRNIDHLIANDFRTISAAIDQGKLISEIKSKSRVERDLDALVNDIMGVARGHKGNGGNN